MVDLEDRVEVLLLLAVLMELLAAMLRVKDLQVVGLLTVQFGLH
jgi:hypothetical protein